MENSIFREDKNVTKKVVEKSPMEELPLEDYGDYWLESYRSEDGFIVSNYVRKSTKVVERKTFSVNNKLVAETLYNPETGLAVEGRAYDANGKLVEFIDADALSKLPPNIDLFAEYLASKNRSLTPEQVQIFADYLDMDEKIKEERLMGRDPDIGH